MSKSRNLSGGDGEIRLHFYSARGGRGIEIEVFTSF